MLTSIPRRSSLTAGLLLSGALILSACSPAPVARGVSDPYELENRARHADNQAIERNLIKPVTGRFGSGDGAPARPSGVRRGLINFASNLDMPGAAVNKLLQARPGDALANTARFVVNSTVGVAGFFDPATSFGLPARDTDFGETLYTWGAGEGDYLELPVLGPSTERDAFGRVVDLAINPVGYLFQSPESTYISGLGLAGTLARPSEYPGLADGAVGGDALDSYTRTRNEYLTRRRQQLQRR